MEHGDAAASGRGTRFAAFTRVNSPLGDLAGHLDRLARSKFRLARFELRLEIRRLSRAAALLAVGFVIGSLALAFLLLALVYALAPALSPVAAALFVAVITATGALLSLNGDNRPDAVIAYATGVQFPSFSVVAAVCNADGSFTGTSGWNDMRLHVAGDVDGDGDLDLQLQHENPLFGPLNSLLSTELNLGNGQFAAGPSFDLPLPGSFHCFHAPLAGSYMLTFPEFHSLTQMRSLLSAQTRRAPWPFVGGSMTLSLPVSMSMRPT